MSEFIHPIGNGPDSKAKRKDIIVEAGKGLVTKCQYCPKRFRLETEVKQK